MFWAPAAAQVHTTELIQQSVLFPELLQEAQQIKHYQKLISLLLDYSYLFPPQRFGT